MMWRAKRLAKKLFCWPARVRARFEKERAAALRRQIGECFVVTDRPTAVRVLADFLEYEEVDDLSAFEMKPRQYSDVVLVVSRNNELSATLYYRPIRCNSI